MYDKTAIEEYTTPSGLKRYRVAVVNSLLNKHRFISSDSPEFAIHKATLQEMLWAEQWQERAALKHKKLGLEMNGKRTDLKVRQKLKIAEERTNIAQGELAAAYNVLRRGLESPISFDWDFFERCPDYPALTIRLRLISQRSRASRNPVTASSSQSWNPLTNSGRPGAFRRKKRHENITSLRIGNGNTCAFSSANFTSSNGPDTKPPSRA